MTSILVAPWGREITPVTGSPFLSSAIPFGDATFLPINEAPFNILSPLNVSTIDSIEDAESRNTHDYQFTLEQSTAQNEEINIQHARSNFGLLLEETDGDNIIGEDDTTSVGESILLENAADSGDPSYLITEDYIVGDGVQDKTAQNELFDSLDDDVLDFSETNPFGDAGVFA